MIHRCQLTKNNYADTVIVDENELTEEKRNHAVLLLSLLQIREHSEQLWSVPDFDRNEIEMMVEFICAAWFRLGMHYK